MRTRYCSRCLTTFHDDVEGCPNLSCRNVRPAGGWGDLLNPGEVLDRTYRIDKVLAIGGAGVTYLARELGHEGAEVVGPKLAIKVLWAQRDQGGFLRRLATEAQILQGVQHPQIVECRGFVNRTGHPSYLVTRFEEGGSLLDHVARVGPLPLSVAAQVARQICWALEVAHRQGVIHRDLKPENVLLAASVARETVPDVRVADFGIAKVHGSLGGMTRVGAFVGTPAYAAPEQFEGTPPEPAADVYALGALLLFCVTTETLVDPSEGHDIEALHVELLRRLPPRLPAAVGTPAARARLEGLLARVMAVSPADRPGLGALERELAALASEVELQGPYIADEPVRLATVQGQATRGSGTVVPDLLDGPADDGGTTGMFQRILRGSDEDDDDAPLSKPAAPSPAPGPPRVTSSPAPAAPTAPTPVVFSNSLPAALPVPPAEPAPAPAPEPPVVAPKRASGGLLVGAIFLGALACGGVGAGWYFRDQLPAGLVPGLGARTLTQGEVDPVDRADHDAIAGTLGRRVPDAAVACNANPAGLQVAVIVDPGGVVTRAELLQYAGSAPEGCLYAALRQERFPRAAGSTETVRVAVTLP